MLQMKVSDVNEIYILCGVIVFSMMSHSEELNEVRFQIHVKRNIKFDFIWWCCWLQKPVRTHIHFSSCW